VFKSWDNFLIFYIFNILQTFISQVFMSEIMLAKIKDNKKKPQNCK